MLVRRGIYEAFMSGPEGSYLLETLMNFVCDRTANAPYEHDRYVMAPCCEPAELAEHQPITILLIAVADLASSSPRTDLRRGSIIARSALRKGAIAMIALVCLSAASGCASMKRNAYCALAGAGAGAAGGIIFGVNEDNYDAVDTMAVTVGGAAAGALVGYGVCAIADLVQ